MNRTVLAITFGFLFASSAFACQSWEINCNGNALGGGTVDGYGTIWKQNLGGGYIGSNGQSWQQNPLSNTWTRSDGLQVRKNTLGDGYSDNQGNTYHQTLGGGYVNQSGRGCRQLLSGTYACD